MKTLYRIIHIIKLNKGVCHWAAHHIASSTPSSKGQEKGMSSTLAAASDATAFTLLLGCDMSSKELVFLGEC